MLQIMAHSILYKISYDVEVVGVDGADGELLLGVAEAFPVPPLLFPLFCCCAVHWAVVNGVPLNCGATWTGINWIVVGAAWETDATICCWVTALFTTFALAFLAPRPLVLEGFVWIRRWRPLIQSYVMKNLIPK